MMGDSQIDKEEIVLETPKELWETIMEHMKNTNAALQDLNDALITFNKSAL